MDRVTVVIPTIPARAENDLLRAVHSVETQLFERDRVDTHIVRDAEGAGPAVMRNYGVARADTEWVAFLDDDDYLLMNHLATLVGAAETTRADVVWPWFRVEGGTDPFPHHRGKQWDAEHPHMFPITALVRRSAFEDVGGFDSGSLADHPDGMLASGEDWRLWLKLSAAGARFHHVDRVTWVWRHHGRNTSGLPDRAKEMYL